jgi:hypothetical protein
VWSGDSDDGGDTGKHYDFCCKNHADAAPTCAIPHCRAKVFKDKHCCSRTHGRLLNRIREGLTCQAPDCSSTQLHVDDDFTTRMFCTTHTEWGRCKLAGCTRDQRIDEHGLLSLFCSDEHRQAAKY